MHRAQEQVLDFHRATKSARPPRPRLGGLNPEEAELHLGLIEEEFRELKEAHERRGASIVDQIGELCDILYVTYGYAVALGVDLEPYFNAVHAANMEKVGGPKRPDGKQLKPEGWQPPDLQAIFYKRHVPTFMEEES